MDEAYQAILSTLLTPIAFGLAVLTAWLLRRQISEIIKTTGITDFEFSKGGVKLKFDIETLANDMFVKQGMGTPSIEDVQEVATLIKKFSPYVSGRKILWVDNKPGSNQLERSTLTRWGVEVQTRRSTDTALIELLDKSEAPFDLVISDWYREGKPEGKRLAERMHAEKIDIPILFYFYAGEPAAFEQIKSEAHTLNAIGATSSPRELLRWTFAELVRGSLRDTRVGIG